MVKKNTSGPKSKSIAGQKFGKLTAISMSHRDKESKQHWIFKCDCGKTKTLKRISVTRSYGAVRSCGCLVIESNKNPEKNFSNLLPKGTTAAHAIYNVYIYRSKLKKIVFELDKKYFKDLIALPCHYCGVEPSNLFKKKGRVQNMFYNGIDRYDDNIGYTYKNSVPCCKICNWAKGKINGEDFENYINRLVKHTISKKGIL